MENEDKKEIVEKKEEKQTGKEKAKKFTDNKLAAIMVAILVVLIAVSYAYSFWRKKTDIGVEGAKTKVEKFIKDQGATGFTVKNVEKKNGLYKITVEGSGQELETYMTKDGKTFFPQSVALEDDGKESLQTDTAAKEIPKTDKPSVELFVMSYCPYGTQIEKGILPVVDLLKDKIDFKLKFVDYAMHGKKEIDENLVQYCIGKNQPTKLNSYLSCFLKKGEGTTEACMKTAGVNSASVKSCVIESDKQFKVSESLGDKSKYNGQFPPFNVNKEENDKYGVQGSPTLVINGVEASSERDSASLLKTICSAFSNAPEQCQKQLSSTAPAPGFGEGSVSENSATSEGACQ